MLINVNRGGVKPLIYKEITVSSQKKGGRKW